MHNTNYYSMNNDYDLIPEIDLNKYEELEVAVESPVDGLGGELTFTTSSRT